jgi:large subunit ribosomal protein L35
MPKLKRNSGVKKRFKITKKGKIFRLKAYKGHLMEGKRPARRRRLSKYEEISPAEKKRIKKVLY